MTYEMPFRCSEVHIKGTVEAFENIMDNCNNKVVKQGNNLPDKYWGYLRDHVYCYLLEGYVFGVNCSRN